MTVIELEDEETEKQKQTTTKKQKQTTTKKQKQTTTEKQKQTTTEKQKETTTKKQKQTTTEKQKQTTMTQCPPQTVSTKAGCDKGGISVGKMAVKEKMKKMEEAKEEKRQKEEALRKSKQKVLADLEKKLTSSESSSRQLTTSPPRQSTETLRKSPRKPTHHIPSSQSPLSYISTHSKSHGKQFRPISPSQSPAMSSYSSTPVKSLRPSPSHSMSSFSSTPTKTPPTSSYSYSPRKSPRIAQESLTFQSAPLNKKGYPTCAQKQPRAHVMASTISPSTDSSRCSNCITLEKENRGLKRKIEELSCLSPSSRSADQYYRPKAGVHSSEFASANGMKQLFPATDVYLHLDEYQTALNKSAPSLSPRAKGNHPSAKRDGKRVSRYLLTVFFSKEELENSSLTDSELSKYPALNKQIVDSIVSFSVYNSDSPKGEIMKAMRASLTSKRCKQRKSAQTTA